MKKLLSAVLTIIFIGILLMGVAELPEFGKSDNPQNNYVVERYLTKGIEETGATNIITGIILDYRAFDTFGEAAVLFVAVVSVAVLLKVSRGESC